MLRDQFDFPHIIKTYPAATKALVKWCESTANQFAKANQQSFFLLEKGGTTNWLVTPGGFYWLLEFFMDHEIVVTCAPNEKTDDPRTPFKYLLIYPSGKCKSGKAGSYNDNWKAAFLWAFEILESILKDKQ